MASDEITSEEVRKHENVTVRQLAEYASVSTGTVSAVINGSDTVSSNAKKRVEIAITALGYQYRAARSQSNKNIKKILVILPSVGNPFFTEVIEGISSIADKNGIIVSIQSSGGEREKENQLLEIASNSNFNGVLYISATGFVHPKLLKLEQENKLILVDEPLSACSAPHISADNRRGGRKIAEYVISNGHKKIGVISGPQRLATAEQRLAGIREALAGAGANPDNFPLFIGDYTEISGYGGAEELYRKNNGEITAIICLNDLMAAGAYRFFQEKGLSIPRDISITGFDNISLSEHLASGLTTVSQRGEKMGEMAMDLLLRNIETPPLTIESYEIETKLVIRNSVKKINET